MSRTGGEVYAILKQRAEEARRQVHAAAAELGDVEQRARDLVARRTEAVQRLARHYLPELEDDDIARAAVEFQGQLRAVQARQEAEVARLRSALAEAAKTLAAHEVDFRAVTARLDECVRRRTELEERAAELLRAEPGFAELATRVAEAERRLARDEERAQEMAREAAAKLPAYERSKLFQYLVKRQFGTPEYRFRGITRRLDAWVARLIDFDRAKRGYDFLRVTPELVAAEVRRRREEFEPLMAELAEREAKAEAQVGLPEVLAEGERLGAERDRLVEAISAAQRAHRELSEQLASAESRDGKYHAEALRAFSAALDRTETRALEQHALRTPDGQDDVLVAEIARVRREEGELSARLGELSERRAALDRRAVGLERLVRRFREANYDATRSRFDGPRIEDLVGRYEAGELDVDDLWRELQRSHRFVEPAAGAWHGTPVDDAVLGTTSRVLLSAMGHVLGAALHSAARRSVRRGGFSGFPKIRVGGGGFGGFGGGKRGGFTRGGGF